MGKKLIKMMSLLLIFSMLFSLNPVRVIAANIEVTGIQAYYNGPNLLKGSTILKEQIVVLAQYSDGSMKEVMGFSITNPYVYYVGTNTVTIVYTENSKTYTTTIAVTGYELQTGDTYTVTFVSNGGAYVPSVTGIAKYSKIQVPSTTRYGYWFRGWYSTPNFTTEFTVETNVTANTTLYAKWEKKESTSANTFTKTITNGSISTTIRADLTGQKYGASVNMKADLISAKRLEKVVQMIATTDKYLGFELKMEDYTFSEKRPLILTVTIPSSFEAKNSAVFYTTNRTSVMGKMNGRFINSNTYQFNVYQSGTYILMECNDKATTSDETTTTAYVTLSELEEPITVNQQSALIPHFYNYIGDEKDIELSWESSNKKVATVDSEGIITGKRPGTADISVRSSDNSFYAVTNVDVKVDGTLIKKIKLNASKKSLKKGAKFQLKTKITPSNATYKKLKYTSYNKAVATVSSNGKITAKKKGTCYISVETRDGSDLYKSIKVTVK